MKATTFWREPANSDRDGAAVPAKQPLTEAELDHVVAAGGSKGAGLGSGAGGSGKQPRLLLLS